MSDGSPAAEGADRAFEAAIQEGTFALTRPDGRCVVRPDDEWTAEMAATAVKLADGVGVPVLAFVAEPDDEERAVLEDAGFVVARREAVIVFPLDRALAALGEAAPPAGVRILSAADVDEVRLRLLDDDLRQDVPGSDGWRNTPELFCEETFGDPAFDPRTYLVALELGVLVGLVRVWMNAEGPRLGLVGVRRGQRRRGIGAALLAQALRAVGATGANEVTAEYDLTNRASSALAERLGARRLGTTLELVYEPAALREEEAVGAR